MNFSDSYMGVISSILIPILSFLVCSRIGIQYRESSGSVTIVPQWILVEIRDPIQRIDMHIDNAGTSTKGEIARHFPNFDSHSQIFSM
jgi:hypothetical protein